MRKTNEVLMTEGNPIKLIIAFAIPVFIGNAFQEAYVMVDTLVISHGVGIQALVALGFAEWMTWLMTGSVVGLGQGITVAVARCFGENNMRMLRKTVAMSVIVSAIGTVILTVVFELALVPALGALNATAEGMPYAVIYCRIFYAGTFAAMFYNTQASILRGVGDSKTPLVAIFISSAVNVLFDILFVFVFKWGIAGAATATIIAQIISGLFCFRILKKYAFLKPTKEDWKLDGRLIKNIVFLSFPMIFESIIIAVGGLIVQAVIDLYGTAFIAGFAATNRIYMCITIVANSISAAVAVFVGQNFGMMLISRIRETVIKVGFITVGCSVIISLILFFGGEDIIGAFVTRGTSDTQEAIHYGYSYLLSYVWFLWVIYIGQLFRYALQGLERTAVIMGSGIVGFLGRGGIAVLLPQYLGYQILYYDEVISAMGEAMVLAIAYLLAIRTIKDKGIKNMRGGQNEEKFD